MTKDEIRKKNDFIRKNLTNPSAFISDPSIRVDTTRAVADCEDLPLVLKAFSELGEEYFNSEGNNPYGENDFAKVEVNGETYFLKMSYLDSNLEYHGFDVFACMIMFASEY